MRHIEKTAEPATVTETRTAATTDLSTTARARAAFDQLEKARVRAALAREQGWLCAFCMRRIDPDAADARGERTMKIAHRTPIDVDPAQALSWRNLLGSCDGGQRSRWRTRSCDAAQESAALAVDPTVATSCARHLRAGRGLGVDELLSLTPSSVNGCAMTGTCIVATIPGREVSWVEDEQHVRTDP